MTSFYANLLNLAVPMYIFHTSWVPDNPGYFDNSGRFIFWAEMESKSKDKTPANTHAGTVFQKKQLQQFFIDEFPLKTTLVSVLNPQPSHFYIALPSQDDIPLPSPEMALITGEMIPEEFDWQSWKIFGLSLEKPLLFLREIRFLALHKTDQFRLGSDMQFWIDYARSFGEIVRRHQYIPSLRCYLEAPAKKTTQPKLKISTGWEPVATTYEQLIADFSSIMPLACVAVQEQMGDKENTDSPSLLDREQLLRHFSEQMLEMLIQNVDFTKKLQNQFDDNFFGRLINASQKWPFITSEQWRQWRSWKQGLLGQEKQNGFNLGIRLQQAEPSSPDAWLLRFFVESRQDPSLKLSLTDYWHPDCDKSAYKHFLDHDFEKNLLLGLGQAARICPLLWDGLESNRPVGLTLNMEAAFAFLKNDAGVLEDAGFKISLPSWWTPKGRRRAQIRTKASVHSTPGQEKSDGQFNLTSILQYDYQLSIGEQVVTEDEWELLVNAKSPLIHFRGEWMEIDKEQMESLLALWKKQQSANETVTLTDMLRQAAEADEQTQIYSFDDTLSEMLSRLRDNQRLQLLDTPQALNGDLREYQKRGLSWLVYLESLGLHPCLADDMGLGKTIQVIARLVQERAQSTESLAPTLLIAPTSVLGNWQKEIERFAGQLATVLHHGATRTQTPAQFKQDIAGKDVVITSFSLARRDASLFNPIDWHRVVIDEAQNIKNPQSAQAKAIFRLNAKHRLAMTGTPIENRLMDMWSIFHFLNPGYLGTATQFKKTYETPIQRDSDTLRSTQLKKLITPFILRRLKTDKSIIKDLPDKIEQKVYCNLTQEQASLYQAVVDDIQVELAQAEGIQRKGLMLSTLMKLKQICNHPAQFLQDGSDFSTLRSHKLARVSEMVEEAITEGDSLLIFTQFTEIGAALEKHLRENYHYPVYYLHGGTARKRREQMIEQFQDEDAPASIFVLSLKAGGVGITLTRANHVFHFDRWWNPAVENQATDRAFRIGQTKTVFAHKMVALGTLEERIDQMLEEKQKLSESIIGNDESWLTELDNDAFRALIQLNKNTILEA